MSIVTTNMHIFQQPQQGAAVGTLDGHDACIVNKGHEKLVAHAMQEGADPHEVRYGDKALKELVTDDAELASVLDLVHRMLAVETSNRISVQKALTHPFLA